jgi:hypothetical protein
MWADNETDIDLLGFDYLVDSLELVLTDDTLYPITVGVLGDWGSGKTSLMDMAARHIGRSKEYLCVGFSPWRFESYDDVKTALMATVLRAVEHRISENTQAAIAAGIDVDDEQLERVRERLSRLWVRVRGFVPKAAGPLIDLGAGALGAPPVLGQLAAGALETAMQTPEPDSQREGGAAPPSGESAPEYTSAAAFRTDFRQLVNEIDGLKAVIVFVDDLDRCLPPTIIETFEAIRLFLHAPKTAYVLAAHPAIIEAAVAHRYEGNREGDANLGRDYLEKIVQLPIAVPALSEPEVVSYINLLFAQRHLGDDDFAKIRAAAQRVRESNQVSVAMNYGLAKEALGRELDPELQKEFGLANSIGPTLAQGLKGNPRQIKRFLNALTLRLRTAAKRGVDLDPAVLAKLMVLEYLHGAEFQRLFEWQLAQDGRPAELTSAEAIVRDGVEADGMAEGARQWATQTAIQQWVAVDPPLADVVLGRYFFFSREGLSPAAPAARLTGEQQELLARLQTTVGALRQAAVDQSVALDAITRNPVFDALLVSAVRDPNSPALRSAFEIAQRIPELVVAFASALDSIPPARVPGALPLQIKATFGELPPEIETVFLKWQDGGKAALKKAAARALKDGAS